MTYTRQGLTVNLRALADRLGHVPSPREIARSRWCACPATYVKYFGSLYAAYIAAGLEPPVPAKREKAKRRRVVAPRVQRNTERDEYVAACIRAGHTLQSVADTLGITRERVRQLAHRAGVSERVGHSVVHDPVKILAAARRLDSIAQVAKETGFSTGAISEVLRELGVRPALERLWRWRCGSRRRARVAARLRAFANELGRTPTAKDIMGFSPSLYVEGCRTFGSIMAFRAAAGLPYVDMRTVKSAHCIRGHANTPENRYPSGACRLCSQARDRSRNARQHVAA